MPLIASSNIAWFGHIPGTVSFGMSTIRTKVACFILCYYGKLNHRSCHFVDKTEVQHGGDQMFTGLSQLEEVCLIIYGTGSEGSEEPILAFV